MSKHIHYTGPSDSYGLDSEDLTKVGIEGFQETIFPLNTPVEVDDAVAEALVGNTSGLFGQFAESTDEDLKIAEAEKADNPPAEVDQDQLGDADSTPQTIEGEGDSLPGMPPAGRGRKGITSTPNP